MSYRINDEMRQAKSRNPKEVNGKLKKPKLPEPPKADIILSRSTTVVSKDADSKNSNHEEEETKKDTTVSDWAWEMSEHEGLLTFHDGRKRWYHCQNCEYHNDRLYHSKMHFERIHVKNGKSMPRKRKYPNSSNVPVSEGGSAPKALAVSRETFKPIPAKVVGRLPSPGSSKTSPTKSRAPAVKCEAPSPPLRLLTDSGNAADDTLSPPPSSVVMCGRWNTANARILTFGDGFLGSKVCGGRIGEGVSLNVQDLKSPRTAVRPAIFVADAADAGRRDSAMDAADADAAACAALADLASDKRCPRAALRSRVQFVVLPAQHPAVNGAPASAGASFAGPDLGRVAAGLRSAVERPVVSRHRYSGLAGGSAAGSEENSPVKCRRISERSSLSPDADDGGAAAARPAAAPRGGGGGASGLSGLATPASTPLSVPRLMRPRADRSTTPADLCGSGASERRHSSFPVIPRDFDMLLRTPTRPDPEAFAAAAAAGRGGGDGGGGDMPSPLLSFGSPAAGGRRRPPRRVDGDGSVWERLACHETLECGLGLDEDADENEIYEWHRSMTAP
jgi:hypothetical protein